MLVCLPVCLFISVHFILCLLFVSCSFPSFIVLLLLLFFLSLYLSSTYPLSLLCDSFSFPSLTCFSFLRSFPYYHIFSALIFCVSFVFLFSVKGRYWKTLCLLTSTISKGQSGDRSGSNECFFRLRHRGKVTKLSPEIALNLVKYVNLRDEMF